jgi:hypothetical protein
MRKSVFQYSLSIGAFTLFLQAAQVCAALPQQTFVSATGSDSNACSKTQPCATFQGALSKTATGGEIDAMTPGNYAGTEGLVINNSITIDGKGMASMSLNSGQIVAVNEYATGDTVILRGLSINGGTAPGASGAVEGIYYPGGGTLIVEQCVVSGFAYDGIVNVTNGTSTLIVRNTTIANSPVAIYVNEDGGVTIMDHVTITGASSYAVYELNSPGTITIDDSTISGGQYGVFIANSSYYGTQTAQTMIERSTITETTLGGVYIGVGYGGIDSSTFLANNRALEVNSHGVARLSNNSFYNNKLAFDCFTTAATIDSANNNRVDVIPTGAQSGCSAFGTIGMK